MIIEQNEIMVYVIGLLGFIGGFLAGQFILLKMLKDRSKDDLMNNKSLHVTFGLLNWAIAGIGAYLCVTLYQIYFS